MGENIHLACKWGRNQPVWEFSGWRLFHQVHLIFCWNCEAKYTQDPGRLDLCRWPRYKVVVVVITLLFKIKSRRVVFWNDANGSTFVLSSLGSEELEKHPMIVEDCTVGFSLFFCTVGVLNFKISFSIIFVIIQSSSLSLSWIIRGWPVREKKTFFAF